MSDQITFTLDGEAVTARPGETIWEVAHGRGLVIPHLCHKPQPGYRSDGNCRACMVQIEGERTLAASCIREPSEGMVVTTDQPREKQARKMVMELLVADQPEQEVAHDKSSHLWNMAAKQDISQSRFPAMEPDHIPLLDDSHVAMSVNLDACIQCGLCVRACREVQVNDVIGMAGRGRNAYPVFDMDDPMGASSCVACGECVQACPTGALLPATVTDENQRGDTADYDREVESVCPFCGVGCQVSLKIKDNKVKFVEGINGPANEGRLCVKGRFGFDYIHHDHRITRPLIRRDDAPVKGLNVDPGNWQTHFREASWEEALDVAAEGLKSIGGTGVAGFGSAKCTNEEAYLFQKLIRQGFGHNNVDHCTRLCHASSVAALMENVGSGAVTATFNEIENADAAIVIGANPIENHPVAATYFKQFTKRGGKLIVMDPRGQALKRFSSHMLQFRPGADVSMLNAIMHTIVEEELYDRQYIEAYTENWEAEKAHLKDFTPEKMADICGIDAETLRDVARTFAGAKAAMIFWGMGISQHIHGTDNSRCLISLALMTGQVGRPGSGLHPLRGQNNVHGASDAGLIPMFLPDYQPVGDDGVRSAFQEIWQEGTIDPNKGLTVTEILDAVHTGDIKGMYILGENPAMSDPDVGHAREALAKLEHLVVQDIFLTETANFADVILPAIASQRQVDYEQAGLSEQEDQFLSDSLTGLILVLMGIYLVLAWVFSSWTRPVVVMAIIPFGLVGTIYGHSLWDVPLSMFTVVGLLGMTGIIINDSIVLVTTIDEYAEDRGLFPSIIDGAADRLRPVMLTTLTTVLGMTPLLYETSQQAQFLKPTIITLVYGLGFGMILVLLVVPALVAIQHDVARQIKAMRRGLVSPAASVRWSFAVLWALVLGWFAVTLGHAILFGALPQVVIDAVPSMADRGAMSAALTLFCVGVVGLGGVAYVLGALGFQIARRRAA